MNNEELKLVYAGASLNGTLLNALVRVGSLIFDIARALGSSLRRTRTGSYC